MMRRTFAWLAVLLINACMASALPLSAQAQSKSLLWERLDTEIEVREDGTLHITETNVIYFTRGTFTFGFREIPYNRLTAVRDVRVSELDPAVSQEIPLRIERSQGKEGLLVKYYFSRPAERELRTFIVRYTVEGAIRYYDEGDQVWWAVVYADRNGFDVRQARATLRLPAGATVQKAEVYGVRAEVRGVGESVLVAEALEPIPNGVTMELRAQFQHGIVRGTPPPWQREFDARRRFEEEAQPVITLVALLFALLLTIGGPAAAAVIYVTRGRDPEVGLVAEYLTAPPNIPPGLGGALYDEHADVQDIVATIVDLARREVLQLREEEPNKWAIARGAAFGTAALEPFERLLINRLGLESREWRRIADLDKQFYFHLPVLQNAIYDALVQRGYYTQSPEKTRARYNTIAAAFLLIGGAALFAAAYFAETLSFALLCPPLGLMATGSAFLVVARHMPVRTRQGAEMRMRVAAFRRYLQNVERYTDINAAPAIFERYLPWAIALGLRQSWVRKFSNASAPLPPWYVPYEPPFARGFPTVSGWSGGGRLAIPAPSQPDISGAATQAPSLERIEQSLGRSLSAFERNLSGMFDALARNLVSAPPSSRSSGGWSGGGFRGGGFSGGGRGGFG